MVLSSPKKYLKQTLYPNSVGDGFIQILWVLRHLDDSVKHRTLGQVMILQSMSLSPASGSVLRAQSLEPASDSVSPTLSPLPSLGSQKKKKEKRTIKNEK